MADGYLVGLYFILSQQPFAYRTRRGKGYYSFYVALQLPSRNAVILRYCIRRRISLPIRSSYGMRCFLLCRFWHMLFISLELVSAHRALLDWLLIVKACLPSRLHITSPSYNSTKKPWEKATALFVAEG